MTERKPLSSDEMIRSALEQLTRPIDADTPPAADVPPSGHRFDDRLDFEAKPEPAPSPITPVQERRAPPSMVRPTDRIDQPGPIDAPAAGRTAAVRQIFAVVRIVIVVLVGLGVLGVFVGGEEDGQGVGEDEATLEVSEAVATLNVGSCFNAEEFVAADIDTVDCDETHDYEMIGRVELDAGAYPGELELSSDAFEACVPVFEQYVGTSYPTSIWWLDAITPAETGWDDGDRKAACVVFRYDPDDEGVLPIAGSAAGDGR